MITQQLAYPGIRILVFCGENRCLLRNTRCIRKISLLLAPGAWYLASATADSLLSFASHLPFLDRHTLGVLLHFWSPGYHLGFNWVAATPVPSSSLLAQASPIYQCCPPCRFIVSASLGFELSSDLVQRQLSQSHPGLSQLVEKLLCNGKCPFDTDLHMMSLPQVSSLMDTLSVVRRKFVL